MPVAASRRKQTVILPTQRLSEEYLLFPSGHQAPLACALQTVDLPTKRVAARLGILPVVTDDASSPLTITPANSINAHRPVDLARQLLKQVSLIMAL